jgi:hypothetical protein
MRTPRCAKRWRRHAWHLPRPPVASAVLQVAWRRRVALSRVPLAPVPQPLLPEAQPWLLGPRMVVVVVRVAHSITRPHRTPARHPQPQPQLAFCRPSLHHPLRPRPRRSGWQVVRSSWAAVVEGAAAVVATAARWSCSAWRNPSWNRWPRRTRCWHSSAPPRKRWPHASESWRRSSQPHARGDSDWGGGGGEEEFDAVTHRPSDTSIGVKCAKSRPPPIIGPAGSVLGGKIRLREFGWVGESPTLHGRDVGRRERLRAWGGSRAPIWQCRDIYTRDRGGTGAVA